MTCSERPLKSRTPEYAAWRAMRYRCTDPTHPSFPDYGARGITVCSRWLDSFDAFLADLGPRPDGMSIERTDNNRGYEPGNCCWATRARQQRNKRPTRSRVGIAGVCWLKGRGQYQVYLRRFGVRVSLGFTSDFFEACCRRKSGENKFWSAA